MLTCGNLGMARARSQFSRNFFACAGIKVIDNTYFVDRGGVKAALEVESPDRRGLRQRRRLCRGRSQNQGAARRQGDPRGCPLERPPAHRTRSAGHRTSNFINVKSNVWETLKFYLKDGNLIMRAKFSELTYDAPRPAEELLRLERLRTGRAVADGRTHSVKGAYTAEDRRHGHELCGRYRPFLRGPTRRCT